jgi:hypothetical protein
VGSADLVLFVVVLAGSAAVAWLNVGRSLLFLRPESLAIEPEAPADQAKVPDELSGLARELGEQGFTFLGSHTERAWQRKTQTFYDFAHLLEGTFATIWMAASGERELELWTWSEAGGLITANHRRPVREEPGRYQSSYLEKANVARLVKAHSRRAEGRKGQGPFTLEGRVEVGRAWLAGPGRTEIRQQHLSGLLWTLGTLVMVAAAVYGRS